VEEGGEEKGREEEGEVRGGNEWKGMGQPPPQIFWPRTAPAERPKR